MKRFDYLLAGLSGLWAIALLTVPSLVAWEWAFYATAGLIGANLLVSLVLLIRRGKVQVVLNLAQLPLFCLLNYQLLRAFGLEHYRWDADPTWWDWVELTGVHFLRAVDVLDGLEEYGIDLQNVEHNSVFAGLLLVWMHVTVDIFLLSLVFRWFSRLWRHRYAKQRARALAPYLRWAKLGGLAACVVVVVGCGLTQRWRTSDWYLWPFDNVLRTLDIGDMFQIFDWRLHGVSMGVGTMTLAITFRFFAGIYAAEWLNYLRHAEFEGLGATIDDLVDALGSKSPAVVKSASESLLSKGPTVVPALVEALGEDDLRHAATAVLARFGAVAAPPLLGVLDDPLPEVRAAAATALGSLGTAPGVVPALSRAFLDPDLAVRMAALEALGHMGPPAQATFVRALADQNEKVRIFAVMGLGCVGETAIPALIRTLEDPSEDVRLLAVAALSPLGGAAPAALLGAMRDESAAVRASATRALASSTLVSQLANELTTAARSDPSAEVRQAAVYGLGRIPAIPAVQPVLIAALDDQDSDVCLAAVDALARYGPGESVIDALIARLANSLLKPAVVVVLAGFGSAAVPRLIAAQGNDDARVSSAAADILIGLGPPVVEPLARALRDAEPAQGKRILAILARIRPAESVAPAIVAALGDARTSFAAGKLLLELGRSATPSLIEGLAYSNDEVRRAAGQLLGRLGPLAADELCAALVDPRENVRGSAATVLNSLGNNAVPALRDAMERGSAPGLRAAAAEALGRFGPERSVVRVLLSAQSNGDAETRRAAAHALHGLGPRVVPALIESLADAPPASRQVALRALGRLGRPGDTVPVLIGALADPALRATAVAMLGELGPRAASAASTLCALAKSGTLAEQIAVIDTLRRIGPVPGVVPALIERLFTPVPAIRDAAAAALHDFGPAATPALVKALSDPNPGVRLVAAQTLGRVAAPENAVPALIDAMKDAYVRPTAALALGQIGPLAAEAVPSLQYMLRVGDPTERQVAYEALRRIGI